MTRHTAAGIDIGPNTTRLLIIAPEGRQLERHMSFTRLGEGVDKNGYLLPEAIERTLDTLKDYANLLDLS